MVIILTIINVSNVQIIVKHVHHQHVQNAKMVIVTLGRPENTVKAASMLLRNFPNLEVWLRLSDNAKVEMLRKMGAHVVVPQLFEASLQLGENVLNNLGITSEDAKQTVEKIRAQQKLQV